MQAIKGNLVVLLTFVFVVGIYFVTVYGWSNLHLMLSEIMIHAPKRINGYILAIDFSGSPMLRIFYGVFAIFAPLAVLNINQDKYGIFYSICGILAIAFVFKAGNLSGTPFISIVFSMLVLFGIVFLNDMSRKQFMAVLVGIAPCFLILTPYPNYAYHSPIIAFLLLLCFSKQDKKLLEKATKPYAALNFALLAVIGFYLLYTLQSTSTQIKSLQTFSFRNILFRSGDLGWVQAIEEANRVNSGVGNCATYGCRYLVLTQDNFNSYESVIEVPVWRSLERIQLPH